MDIDAHISGYRFHPDKASRKRVRNAREYLDKLRPFHADGRKMIALDYTHGDGYGGYLQQAGPVYFRDAVETVADVWFTVLRPEKDASDTVPSARAMTGYLVEEIGYLLAVKKNRIEAEKVYSSFASVNPGLPDTYEKVGDLFYAFGDEERGIQEWKTAVGFAWSERKRVTKKLAHHYLKFGKTCLEKAAAPRPEERDLPNALDAFTQCLEYDRENVEAGALLRKTRAAIADREERRELAIRIVSSASKLVKQAEADENEQAWANAISGYGRASLLFETVEEEFADQYKASQKGMDQCKKQVSRIVDTLLTKAAEAIDTGDLCLKENKYDEAIGLYQSIESMVNVIPGDESTTVSKQRKEMVASAKEKVEAALVAKKRYEQEQRDRQPQMPQTAEAGG
jgi:tetratricopeptide (TPR) repeat protein